jgi:outer membrane protein assembly factor BamD
MRRLIVLTASCLLLFSCMAKPVKKVESPGDLYVQGVNLMKKKDYHDAIQKFSLLRENYPFDPMATIAAVKMGDAHFELKDYTAASNVYEDFFNSHPDDENIPYVLTKLGECYERLALSMDQDQANTLKAIERLTYLKNRYATSTYAAAADARLKKLYQRLADRELYVGEFYYRTYQYNAAIYRLDYLIKKYPETKGLDKAFYCIAMSYKALGDPLKSQYYFDQLRSEYPDSIYVRSKKRERKVLQESKPVSQLKPGSGPKKEIDLRPQAPTPAEPEPGTSAAAPPVTDGQKKTGSADQKTSAVEGKKQGSTIKDLDFIDKKKPLDIVSDTMEGFDKEKYVVFKGNVHAKQEDLSIFSDVMEAYLNEETNEVGRANAKGNVRIIKNDRTATSDEASFDNTKGEITLRGHVVVYQGQDKLTGDVITYYVNEDRAVVAGDKDSGARVVLTPK